MRNKTEYSCNPMQQDIQKIWESDEQQQEADQKMCERRSRYGTKEGTDGSQQRQQGQQQQEQQETRSVRLNTHKKKGGFVFGAKTKCR